MKPERFLLCTVLAVLSLFQTCKSPDLASDPTVSRCGELAGTGYVPVAPGEIVCAARDSAGVLYAVDKSPNGLRLFVSQGNTLFRKMVSGSSIIGEQYYFLSIDNGSQIVFRNYDRTWSDVFLLEAKCKECDSLLSSHIDPRNKSADDLIAGWDEVCRFLQDDSPNTIQLAVATSDDINSCTLQNYPPVTHIEYAAEQQSGHYILVTRSYYDWNGDVVLHYGLPDEMEKREVVRFLRASDGGSTWITFMVGLASYEAFFGVKLDSTGLSYGKCWLKIGNDTLNLERKSADRQTLQMLGFDCSIELK